MNLWCDLTLFGVDDMGGLEVPELTRQATGEQAVENAPVAEGQSDEARKVAFRNLMEGEYKDLFHSFFQETFNRRFKEQKSIMEELERARSVIDAVAARYGTRDEEALVTAIRTEMENVASAEAESEGLSREEMHPAELNEAIDAAVRAAVERAREETERAVTESIRARGMRPTESALTPGVSGAFGGNALRLTRAERAEMARRAARGERIEF